MLLREKEPEENIMRRKDREVGNDNLYAIPRLDLAYPMFR